MTILIIDDRPEKHKVIRRAYEDAEDMKISSAFGLTDGMFLLDTHAPLDICYLDHDLGGGQSGMEVADYIIRMKQDKRPRKVILHSWAPTAASEISSKLAAAGIDVEYKPFSQAVEI